MFRVSFDLIIHSYVRGKGRKGWTSVFSFKGNGGKRHCCKHGDRVPEIALDKNGGLRISNSVSGNAKYSFISKVGLNKWYSIIIEQKSNHGKVILKITSSLNLLNVRYISLLQSMEDRFILWRILILGHSLMLECLLETNSNQQLMRVTKTSMLVLALLLGIIHEKTIRLEQLTAGVHFSVSVLISSFTHMIMMASILVY